MDEQELPEGEVVNRLASSNPHHDPLYELLEQHVVVGLSQSDWEKLAPLLEGDQDAIRRYAEAVHMRELLLDYAGGMPPFKSILQEGFIFDEASSTDSIDTALQPEKKAEQNADISQLPKSYIRSNDANSSLRIGKIHDSNLLQQSSLIFNNWLSIASAVCIALFVGLASGYFISEGSLISSNPSSEQIAQLSKPRPSATRSLAVQALVAKESLGRITGLSPEASANGLLRSFQVGEELRRGEVVQLVSGLMQVSFADGPIAMIQGPAEFSVVADRGLYVKHGHIKTTALGNFELQTPLVRIDSLDAEIDVVADRDQSTSVYSFSGHAEVHSNSKRLSQGKLLRNLDEGQGIQVSLSLSNAETTSSKPDLLKNGSIESDLVVEDALAPKVLVASWQEVNKSLHPYEQEVLSDKPLAYWPLYRVQRNRRVLDLSQNGFDGQAVGDWPLELKEVKSKRTRGAYFSGESYIEPDLKPPVDYKTGFTIESWANISGGPEFQSIFTSRWVLGSNTPNQQCFGFTLYAGDDDHWQFWSGSGEYGAEWQVLKAPAKVKRHQWTHVAASFSPYPEDQQPDESAGQWVEGLVELYVGGEKVAEATHRLSLMDFEWPARIGAAEFVPKSLTSWLFQGDLRDVALYDYVVSQDRIKLHTKVGASAI